MLLVFIVDVRALSCYINKELRCGERDYAREFFGLSDVSVLLIGSLFPTF